MDAPSRGEPSPRGRGGSPPRKNDQNRREVAQCSQYKKPKMEQYCNTEMCLIQPVNRVCKGRHPLHPLKSNILRAIFVDYHWEKVKSEITLNSILQGFLLCSEIQIFFNLWNSLFMSQISSLLLLMMMAIVMVMIIMMVMLIMITIKVMNVE